MVKQNKFKIVRSSCATEVRGYLSKNALRILTEQGACIEERIIKDRTNYFFTRKQLNQYNNLSNGKYYYWWLINRRWYLQIRARKEKVTNTEIETCIITA